MKVTPVAKGAPAPVNPNAGSSAAPDKIARAKAIMTGQPAPELAQEPQQQTIAQKLKSIRMKTNVTPERDYPQPEPVAAPAPEAPVEASAEPALDNSDPNEPASATPEEKKPLSPQFAALAKQRRALEVREKAIQAREEALKQNSQSTMDASALKERIKADPLGVLLEEGVTYDQLTQAVLKDIEGGPALNRVEQGLLKKIESLEKALDEQKKSTNENWDQAQAAVLAQMQRQADQLIATDDAFQSIRDTGSNGMVSDLIKRVLADEGETLEVREALELIENDIVEQGLRFARIKKVQSKLQPEPAPQQPQPAAPQDGVRRQVMRTLTNRDTVSAVPTRRERALAAALGKKLA